MIIIDLEWTCCDNGEFDQKKDGEIIEIGAVMLSADCSSIQSTFQTLVKPYYNHQLTEFCKTLIGIDQNSIDNARDLTEVHQSFTCWAGSYCGFASWGNDDFHVLKRGFADAGLFFPFTEHCNLFRSFRNGQTRVLRRNGMKWHGQRHRALNDAMTYAEMVIAEKHTHTFRPI